MALIGKIRQNFWFVLVLLGFAMVAFVMMDWMNSKNTAQSGGNSSAVGSVNGEAISAQEFERAYAQYPGDNAHQNRSLAWKDLVQTKLVKQLAEQIGLSVSDAEKKDMFSGAAVHPLVKQMMFGTPQVADDQVRNYVAQVNALGDTPEDIQKKIQLRDLAKSVQDRMLVIKTTNLFSKAVYTPTWMAELEAGQSGQTADFDYVFVPFSAIAESEAAISDTDVKAYIDNNAVRLNRPEEKRSVQLVEFDVIASTADTATVYAEVSKITADFKGAANDSTFVATNDGQLSAVYLKKDEITDGRKDEFFEVPVGTVVGPYINDREFKVAKVVDRKVIADSVKARHIFIQPNQQLSVEATESRLDSLKGLLESGAVVFDSLAATFSMDTPTKGQGGQLADDLGYLGYENKYQSLSRLNNYLFFEGKVGVYEVVVTRAGFHLVQIQDIKSTGQVGVQLAEVSRPIVPSEETIELAQEEANSFLASHSTLESIDAEKKNPNYFIRTSNELAINDFNISLLGEQDDCRNITKWAFESTVGDVSPVLYSFTDDQYYYENKFVVAALNEVVPAGLPSVDETKKKYAAAIANDKKADLLVAKLAGKSLNEVSAAHSADVQKSGVVSLAQPRLGVGGFQPSVVGAAVQLKAGDLSAPIKGSNGIYVVKVNAVTAAPENVNLASFEDRNAARMQQVVNYQLIDAVKKTAEVEDTRSLFY